MSPNIAPSTVSAHSDTRIMLAQLTAAISNLTNAHQRLADLLAAPNRADSGAALDEVIVDIREGHTRLEEAEQQRLSWLAAQPISSSSSQAESSQASPRPANIHQEMQHALAAIDRAELTNHLATWLMLQPLIIELDERTRAHQMVISRLGQFIQERVNLLTNAADGSDTAVYAASGKTSTPADRRRSLGDA